MHILRAGYEQGLWQSIIDPPYSGQVLDLVLKMSSPHTQNDLFTYIWNGTYVGPCTVVLLIPSSLQGVLDTDKDAFYQGSI